MKTQPLGPFLGINNRLPDFALHVPKEGDFLRDAVDVDVTNAGNLRRRAAVEQVQAMTAPHSLHMTSGTAGYLVRDSAMYAITLPAYTETLFKVLTSNAPVSWVPFNGDLYYSNGTDSGRISSDTHYPLGLPTPDAPASSSLPGGALLAGSYQIAVSYARYDGTTLLEEGGVSASSNPTLALDGGLRITLPAATPGATHINVYGSTQNGSIPKLLASVTTGTATYDFTVQPTGRESNQRYEDPLPAGTLFLFNGCLCSFNGTNVYEGSPFRPGYYLPMEGRIPFPATVSNAVPAQNGVYVVADKTYWLAGTRMTTTEMIQDVLPYGGVPGTAFSVPHKSVYGWFGEKGLVLGTPSGEVQAVMTENIELTPQARGVSTVLETDGYRRVVSCGWCVNLERLAATRYTGYDFTSTSGGYGTQADGLYRLEATGDVSWSVDFGKHDFGAEHLKRLPAVYLGIDSDLPATLRVTLPDDAQYFYEARSSAADLRVQRVDPGKGLRANWYGLALLGESPFTLASASFAPAASTRRI